MGWASGSYLVEELIKAIKKHVKDDETKFILYKVIIEAFEQCDWDTQDEVLGIDPVFDKAIKTLHPDWDL